jgi:L-threonylcarbamoyladenylate synthase
VKTKITQSPSIAARFIHRGEVVAFPTETVYGLGANIFNEEAVKKIFIAKERPADNPLIAHIFDLSQLGQITAGIPEIAAKLIKAFFPGPLTLILPRNEKVPSVATAGLKTIGVRMPKDPIARQFLRACSVPIAAPLRICRAGQAPRRGRRSGPTSMAASVAYSKAIGRRSVWNLQWSIAPERRR